MGLMNQVFRPHVNRPPPVDMSVGAEKLKKAGLKKVFDMCFGRLHCNLQRVRGDSVGP